MRDFLHFARFEAENRRSPASFSYKRIFTQTQKVGFLRSFRHFSGHSQNAAPATTFDTSPATAIQQNSIFAMSQNAAPATRVDNATAQSAAPAKRKRHNNSDTLLKYRACHAKWKPIALWGSYGSPQKKTLKGVGCIDSSMLVPFWNMLFPKVMCELKRFITVEPKSERSAKQKNERFFNRMREMKCGTIMKTIFGLTT